MLEVIEFGAGFQSKNMKEKKNSNNNKQINENCLTPIQNQN